MKALNLIEPHSGHSWSRFATLRCFFFGLLAFDLVSVTFKHAARYGVGDFNVPQFLWMTTLTPIPNAEAVGGIWLLCALSALFAAMGILTTFSIRLTCLLYSGIYFSSQIDSYQHHYLLAILLLLFAVCPSSFWCPKTNEQNRKSWVPALLYVQIALVYLWTGIAKLSSTWFSGVTLQGISGSDEVLAQVGTLASLVYGIDTDPTLALDAMYRTLSALVVVGELLLPLCFIIPRLRLIGFIASPFFHLGVETLGLDIELFSFYMLGLNFVLLTPARIWQKLDSILTPSIQNDGSNTPSGSRHLVFLGGGIGLYFTQTLHFEMGELLCGIFMIMVMVQLWRQNNRGIRSVWYAIALALMPATLNWQVQAQNSLYDYFRMKGGDLARRLPSTAAPNYEMRLNEVVETYRLANEHQKNAPARRAKLARYLKRAGLSDEAKTTLSEGRLQHEAMIDRLQKQIMHDPTREGLESLVKVQTGLASICQSLRTTYRLEGNDVDLASAERCHAAMRLESRDTLLKLRKHNEQQVMIKYESRLTDWSSAKMYTPSTGQLHYSVSSDTTPDNCDAVLKMRARARYRFTALTFGVPLSRPLPSPDIKRKGGAKCKGIVSASIRPILDYLSVRGNYPRLNRARQRSFKGPS